MKKFIEDDNWIEQFPIIHKLTKGITIHGNKRINRTRIAISPDEQKHLGITVKDRILPLYNPVKKLLSLKREPGGYKLQKTIGETNVLCFTFIGDYEGYTYVRYRSK